METVATHRGEGGLAHSSSDNDTILEVQFDDLEQQHEASTIGMWLFLATEVMFFGGLITAYAVYRFNCPQRSRPGQRTHEGLAGICQYRDPPG